MEPYCFPFRPVLPAKVGFVEVLYDSQHVYKRAEDGRLFNSVMEPLAPYTPEELREISYKTLPIISFDNRLLTVDEAEMEFWHYYPDESRQAIAEELRTKISQAKDYIRNLYPDAAEE